MSENEISKPETTAASESDETIVPEAIEQEKQQEQKGIWVAIKYYVSRLLDFFEPLKEAGPAYALGLHRGGEHLKRYIENLDHHLPLVSTIFLGLLLVPRIRDILHSEIPAWQKGIKIGGVVIRFAFTFAATVLLFAASIASGLMFLGCAALVGATSSLIRCGSALRQFWNLRQENSVEARKKLAEASLHFVRGCGWALMGVALIGTAFFPGIGLFTMGAAAIIGLSVSMFSMAELILQSWGKSRGLIVLSVILAPPLLFLLVIPKWLHGKYKKRKAAQAKTKTSKQGDLRTDRTLSTASTEPPSSPSLSRSMSLESTDNEADADKEEQNKKVPGGVSAERKAADEEKANKRKQFPAEPQIIKPQQSGEGNAQKVHKSEQQQGEGEEKEHSNSPPSPTRAVVSFSSAAEHVLHPHDERAHEPKDNVEKSSASTAVNTPAVAAKAGEQEAKKGAHQASEEQPITQEQTHGQEIAPAPVSDTAPLNKNGAASSASDPDSSSTNNEAHPHPHHNLH